MELKSSSVLIIQIALTVIALSYSLTVVVLISVFSIAYALDVPLLNYYTFDFISNLRVRMLWREKLRLLLKNNLLKLKQFQNCCGHPGEPGC